MSQSQVLYTILYYIITSDEQSKTTEMKELHTKEKCKEKVQGGEKRMQEE